MGRILIHRYYPLQAIFGVQEHGSQLFLVKMSHFHHQEAGNIVWAFNLLTFNRFKYGTQCLVAPQNRLELLTATSVANQLVN